MATLVNICGTSRSGSTILDLMLGNAPYAFSCGGIYARFRPFRRHHFYIDCSCGQKPCPVWEKISNVPASEFHTTVMRELGVSFVIDSSKDLTWLIDSQKWATANQIHTVNFLLWKEPIDLAYSHWKRGEKIGLWRKEFVTYYTRFFEAQLPFSAVNYNALANTPQRVLEAICSEAGMPYFQGKERFWEKEHHYLFGSLGVRRQVQGRNGEIKYNRFFPKEFEAKRSFLEEEISKDLPVQEILAILKQADVLSDAGRGGYRAAWPNHIAPVWFYKKRVVHFLRRHFPENFDTMAP